MKRINVSGTYSFEEVLRIVNDAIVYASRTESDEITLGELIQIINAIADDEAEEEADKAPKKARRRGRPKGAKNKAQPEDEKEEDDAEAENGSPVGASAVNDEFAGI